MSWGSSKAGGIMGYPGKMGARMFWDVLLGVRIGISWDDAITQEPGTPLSRPLPTLHVLFPHLFPALLSTSQGYFGKPRDYPSLCTLS